MHARARVVAEADGDGPCRLRELRDSAPIGLRPTPDGLYLVSTAQGLVGEDQLELDIVVGNGAALSIRSVAASLAYASSGARFVVRASVAAGGRLDWSPEPLIVTERSQVALEAVVTLEEGGALSWTEQCLLGRFEEAPGKVEVALSVDHGSIPLLRHRLVLGGAAPGFDGPAVLGGNRAVGCRVLAGAMSMPRATVGEGWAVLELEGPGVVVTAVAAGLDELRRRLAARIDDGTG